MCRKHYTQFIPQIVISHMQNLSIYTKHIILEDDHNNIWNLSGLESYHAPLCYWHTHTPKYE